MKCTVYIEYKEGISIVVRINVTMFSIVHNDANWNFDCLTIINRKYQTETRYNTANIYGILL